MIIILIHWLIKPGCEEKFKKVWHNMTIQSGQGLYREVLTEPVLRDDPKFNTFSITDRSYKTYINIGFWRSLEDFDKAVGQYIPSSTELEDPKDKRMKRAILLEDFEFKIRERIVLEKIWDRDGGEAFPKADIDAYSSNRGPSTF